MIISLIFVLQKFKKSNQYLVYKCNSKCVKGTVKMCIKINCD